MEFQFNHMTSQIVLVFPAAVIDKLTSDSRKSSPGVNFYGSS